MEVHPPRYCDWPWSICYCMHLYTSTGFEITVWATRSAKEADGMNAHKMHVVSEQ